MHAKPEVGNVKHLEPWSPSFLFGCCLLNTSDIYCTHDLYEILIYVLRLDSIFVNFKTGFKGMHFQAPKIRFVMKMNSQMALKVSILVENGDM